jgi:outer membrane protein assembly factor BamB
VSGLKNKIVTVVLFSLFFASLAGLALHIFPELQMAKELATSGKMVSRVGRYEKISEISLGKVEIRGFKQMGSTPGLVRLSPEGSRLAVGTESGEVMVMDLQGNRQWSRKIGMGKISALEFSNDSRQIYVGENSQQGAVICIDTATGSELWRKASADELSVDIRQKTFPGIMSITVDGVGNAYAVALRSIRFPGGKTEYFARIYKFDAQGIVMQFPRDHNLDVWVSWCDVDEAGTTLAFGTSDYTPGPERKYKDNVYAFDAKTGELRWSQALATVPPYDRTNMRFGPTISDDGKYLGGVSADGRAFLLDAAGKLLWTRTLSAPQSIQGVFLNATGLHVQHSGAYVAFSTGNTYNRANWQLPTPVEHPQSNSVFLFDHEGNLLKRRKLGGMVEEFKSVGNQLAVAIGRNIRTKDITIHGMVLLSAPELDIVDVLPTEGPCVAVAANPAYLVGMEAPLQLDNGEVVGAYRIHVWKKIDL